MRWLLIAALAMLPGIATAQHLTPAGARLITHYEVGGQSAYERKYTIPICPACLTTASGVTIGIGSDLRHQTKDRIRQDWKHHPKLPRLIAAQGLGGQQALNMARSMRDVVTPWPMAIDVFSGPGIEPYSRTASRIFGPGFDKLQPTTQDALKSLVYNRGGSMVGPAREEMRYIRDVCVKLWRIAESANACINRKLREMVRVWAGGSIERGMRARRYDEGRLTLTGRFP